MTASPLTREPPNYQPLVVVWAAVSGGIIADHYLNPPMVAWSLLALFALAGWCALWRLHRTQLAACLLPLAAAAIGGGWHHRCWNVFAENDLGFSATLEPQPVVLEGIALSSPCRMPAPPRNPLRVLEVGDRTRLDVRATAVRNGQQWQAASGNTSLVINGHLFDVAAGDHLRIVGQLFAPSPANNPGEFDYAEYCRGNRVLCLVRCGSPSCVQVLSRGPLWQPKRWIDQVRAAGEAALWRFTSPENAGLAAAMFLGLREELDPEQMDAFKETGTVHLLVISGMNVGILAACVLLLLRTGWLSNRAAIVLLAVVTMMYALITDAQPPVVRATVLVLVFCLANLLGRRGLAFNSLAAAALIVLAINPVELFRPGTQLSFLSVAALIAVGNSWLLKPDGSPTDSLVAQARPARMQLLNLVLRLIWLMTLASFAVWIVIQPLVAARFNLITPSAIILGPLLAVPVAVAMATGFLVMTFGWLLPPVGVVCGFVCDRALSIVVATVEAARNTPGGRFWTAGPSDWWLAGFYGLLAAWVLIPRVRQLPRRWVAAVGVGWIALGLGVGWLQVPARDSLRASFLSVGHGLAVVLELPDGTNILYDAGSMASPEMAARSVSGFLFSRGITRLDRVVISHADADHYNAIPRLLGQFSVGEISVGPQDVPRTRRTDCAPAICNCRRPIADARTAPWRRTDELRHLPHRSSASADKRRARLG